MVLWGEAFRGWLSHEGGSLMKRISALIKESHGALFPIPPCEDVVRRSMIPEMHSHQTLNLWTFCLRLPSLQKLQELNCCLSHPVCGIFVKESQTKRLRQLMNEGKKKEKKRKWRRKRSRRRRQDEIGRHWKDLSLSILQGEVIRISYRLSLRVFLFY